MGVNIDAVYGYVIIYTFYMWCVCMHINVFVPLTSQSTLHTAEGNGSPLLEKSDCFSISILMSRFVKSLQERKKITGSS